MSDLDREPWPEPPLTGDEATQVVAALERQRATFAWKTGGLDAAGLRATTAASSLTLGSLLKHLALVEDNTFTYRIAQREMPAPWRAVDWDADPDWEWRTAADDEPEALYELWREAVARSRDALADTLANGGLDQMLTGIKDERGDSPNLRRAILDTIEEYGRHVGHADIIRESVDGLVGEDRPD